MSNKVVDVKDLKKNFSDNSNIIKAVNEVSFSVNESDIMIIFGRSGSGKSTLLYLLAGLETVTSGQIKFENYNYQDLTLDELASIRRKNIGFVYQFHHLIPEFKAIDNAAFPLLLNGESKEVAYEKSKEILSKFGLEKRLFHKPNQLSGGERQRVAIARALIHDPKFVLLDEPTGDLDRETAQEVRKMLKDFMINSKSSLIIATHDRSFEEISDFQKTMDSGYFI